MLEKAKIIAEAMTRDLRGKCREPTPTNNSFHFRQILIQQWANRRLLEWFSVFYRIVGIFAVSNYLGRFVSSESVKKWKTWNNVSNDDGGKVVVLNWKE